MGSNLVRVKGENKSLSILDYLLLKAWVIILVYIGLLNILILIFLKLRFWISSMILNLIVSLTNYEPINRIL